jgi:hypothetical protein
VNYVLVNDRTPFRRACCVQCREPIGQGYLRDIGTRLCYCGTTCYAVHRAGAVAPLEKRAQSS